MDRTISWNSMSALNWGFQERGSAELWLFLFLTNDFFRDRMSIEILIEEPVTEHSRGKVTRVRLERGRRRVMHPADAVRSGVCQDDM